MNRKDIQYEPLPWKYTDKYIFCPSHNTPAYTAIGSRGAKADIDSLGYNPHNFVKPEECNECEYKMYRILGLTCPCEPPKHRRKK